MQIAQLQVIADLIEEAFVDIFRDDHDWRTVVAGCEICVGANGDGGDNRGLVEESFDQGGASPRLRGILRRDHGNDMARHRREPPAQKIEAWRKVGAQVDRAGIAPVAKVDIFDLIVGADDHHDVVIEARQPVSDALIGPLRIVAVADLEGSVRCRGDAIDEAQRALGAIDDRLPDQLLFGVEGNFVGALRGRQHRHDNADDRHSDNSADRHDQAHAGLVPPRPFPFPGDFRLRRRQHACTFLTDWLAETIDCKALEWLAIWHATTRTRRRARFQPRSLTRRKSQKPARRRKSRLGGPDWLFGLAFSAGWHRAGAGCRYGQRATPTTSVRAGR